MAEWLYEAGIGEARAALVADGRILRARIERPGLRLGTVAEAWLVERLTPGLALVEVAREQAVIERVPAGVTLGARLNVAVVREAIPERGRPKRAKVAASDQPPRPGPALADRIAAGPHPVRPLLAHQPDALEHAGWSEVLAEAETGELAFPGGALRMSITPAMTLFDVDGGLDPDPLAIAAARAVAAAIVRHGIGGSIGLDLPTLSGRAARQAVAAALDATLAALDAGPFERTAVNGFGFLQLVRPRPRPSLPELIRADPATADTLAWLRRLEREPPPLRPDQRTAPAIARRLADRPDWHAELARRTGVEIRVTGA